MTFHFRDWPVQGFEPHIANSGTPRPDRPIRRGPRLVARWQRGADGRLESRWSPPRD